MQHGAIPVSKDRGLPLPAKGKQHAIWLASKSSSSPAKGKAPAAVPALDGKAGRLPSKAPSRLEEGICILCGGEKKGFPAKKDLAISAARKMRSLLKMEERRTIACERCLPTCLAKRAKFEHEKRNYIIVAGVFVLTVVAGGFYFKRLEGWLAVPALLGAAIILLLPYGKYFPSFEISERK